MLNQAAVKIAADDAPITRRVMQCVLFFVDSMGAIAGKVTFMTTTPKNVSILKIVVSD